VTFTELLGAALVAGLVGSLHCAAMCGPLAIGGCTADGRIRPRLAAGYFAGRLVSYALMGALLGSLGGRFAHAAAFVRLQQVALAAVAVGFLWRGVAMLPPPRDLVALGKRRRPPVWQWVAPALPRAGLGLGLATGLLPCGMLMAGWMFAAVTASPLGGAALMAAYSIATAPGVAGALLGRRVLQRWLARTPRRVAGIGWVALAAWLALWPLLTSSHHH
jgi:hypothetical protein